MTEHAARRCGLDDGLWGAQVETEDDRLCLMREQQCETLGDVSAPMLVEQVEKVRGVYHGYVTLKGNQGGYRGQRWPSY